MRRLLAALVFCAASSSAIAQSSADTIYTHPGTLISAGTHRLNFYCMGSGSPTVILEGGFGDWSPAYSGVPERVAKFSRVCSYDRAGFGFSEPGPPPRSAGRLAEDLHTALHNGGIDGPYLLVGLAFGSLPVRAFSDRWMPEVAGMVLISADTPDLESADISDFWPRLLVRQLPQARLCRDWVAAGKPMPMTPPPEYPHLNCQSRFFDGLPDTHFSPELNAVLEHQVATKTSVWDTLISELQEVPNDAAYLKEHRTSFGSRPVRVITANLFHDTATTPAADRLQHMRIAYYEALAQSKLLELSSNSKQIFSDTGMIAQFEKPELVVQAIREAWEQSK